MSKSTNYFGIDISANKFDVIGKSRQHMVFDNCPKGFKQFLKVLDDNSHCVMEATGYYHYRLALFLLENNVMVYVENPLSVKRFIQMRLSKIKTDKADAKMIYLYAKQVVLRPWKGFSKYQMESLQIIRLLDHYTKESTALKNKIHGEQALGNPSMFVVRSLKRTLKKVQKEMNDLNDKLKELVKESYQDMLTRIETIPGIGRKTAIMLIILTDGFEKFETAAQLCSFAGITPIIKQSGTSVKARARISKIGNRQLRNLLFMCSFTACIHNKACSEIYKRITDKGKSKKLALIAVSNKLLKQAFAIAKSGLIYDESYRSTLA